MGTIEIERLFLNKNKRLKDIVIENKKLFLIFEYIDKDLQKYLKDLGKESLTLTQVKVFIEI